MLTIGMATFRDFEGVWSTLQQLHLDRLHHNLMNRVELLVVDNEPQGPHGKHIQNLCSSMQSHYFPLVSPVGTSTPRNLVVDKARGEWVLVLDSHVFLLPGVLPRLVQWCENNPSQDMHQGPLLHYNGRGIAWTHWDDRWGEDGMLGKSAAQACTADSDPFEIRMAGMGLFLTRKDSWLGFHPQQTGFGSEEGCIHEKYRQAGRTTWCQPWLTWVHRFRPADIVAPFPTDWVSRARNYLLWHRDIGYPNLDDIRKHHVTNGRVNQKQWDKLMHDLGITGPVAPPTPAAPAIAEPPKAIEAAPADAPLGPGGHLKAIIATLGINPAPSCECNAKARTMDTWGVAKCKENRNTIVGWLRDGAPKWGWIDTIKAAAAAVTTGLAFKLDLLDPFGSLVDEAIRRADMSDPLREVTDPAEKSYQRLVTVKDDPYVVDIIEHLPKLRELATGAETVVELGVRSGCSTRAFLAARPAKLISYDKGAPPQHVLEVANQAGIEWSYHQRDTTQGPPSPEHDLLFVDSKHTADHVWKELTLHAPQTRQRIVFHDTETFGMTGDDGTPGILHAIRRWLKEHSEWSIEYEAKNCNGLMVLRKTAA